MMLIESPAYLAMGWLRIKLLLVLLLIAYHAYCYALLKDFAAQRNKRSAKWYRAFNEVPSLFLIAIVVLAVVKPFLDVRRATSRQRAGPQRPPRFRATIPDRRQSFGKHGCPRSCSART